MNVKAKNDAKTPCVKIFKNPYTDIEDVSVNEHIAKISAINLENILKEIDPLTCALYFAGYHVAEEIYEKYEDGTTAHKAAEIALCMHEDYSFKRVAISGNFYENFIREIIEVARENMWNAARLMPVIYEARRNAEEHGISWETEGMMDVLLIELSQKLGFSVLEISSGITKVNFFEEKSRRSISASARHWQYKRMRQLYLKKRCLFSEDAEEGGDAT